MSAPVLTDDDKAFITLYRPHQTISCLAKAVDTYYEIVDNYCRSHKLDGPHGRVAWLVRDEVTGRRGPKPPRRSTSTMPPEAAAFLREWRPYQALSDLAVALDLPLTKITDWCYRQKIWGPRQVIPAHHAEQLIQWEIADLCDADREWILAERPRRFIADLADIVGVSPLAVQRICREAKVWGPRYPGRPR